MTEGNTSEWSCCHTTAGFLCHSLQKDQQLDKKKWSYFFMSQIPYLFLPVYDVYSTENCIKCSYYAIIFYIYLEKNFKANIFTAPSYFLSNFTRKKFTGK